MLNDAEQRELNSLEGARKSHGLSNREGGRYDWLKWGKELHARKEKEKNESKG